MRIVHVITRLIVGGAQENTVLSCEGLHARGHEVTLIAGPTTGPEGSLAERARAGKYRFVEIPELVRAVRPGRDWAAMRRLRRLVRELRPEVVHTHSSKAGIVGRIAAWREGVPAVVHTIHGMSFNRTQPAMTRWVYRAAERYCGRRCHAIVCVADAMREQALAAGIGRAEQYQTIRSGMGVGDIDPGRYDREACRRWLWGVCAGETPAPQRADRMSASQQEIGPDEVLVGTVARLFENKGYEQLMEVIARAAPRMAGLRFVWVGDGAGRGRYEQELLRRGLRDRVLMTGLLPPEEMPRLLTAIDILAHTSQWEGLPRAVVQALLMERPAVSFAIDGAPEVVIPGETGALAPLNDVDAFAEELLGFAADASLRRRYGAAGRRRCLVEFDAETMVSKLEGLYATMLSV